MAKLAPIFNDAQFINAIPANGAKLFTYAAGSSTKLATYTDEDGLVPQANPIILNSRGEPAQPIWLLEGVKYKFVFAPSTDTDPPVSPIRTVDDISGINDTSITIDQWVDSGISPTYISATSFTVAGDQTSLFTNKRRLKSFVTAGIAYSTVLSATFTSLTTVVVINDSLPLDTGLSNIQVGLLTPNNPSIPSIIESTRATVAATATTTPLWASTAQVQDWTGTPTITDFPDAPQAGVWRICYPAAGTIFTDNANIDVQGDANYTTQANDRIYIEAITVSTFRVYIERKNGQAVTTSINNTIAQLNTSVTVTDTGTDGKITHTVDGVIISEETDVSRVSTVDGGTALIPEFKCRAWVRFNGTGTPAVIGSGNINATITDNGTGDYTFSFLTAMPDANYVIVGMARAQGSGSVSAIIVEQSFDTAPSTTSFRIVVKQGGTLIDTSSIHVAIFR